MSADVFVSGSQHVYVVRIVGVFHAAYLADVRQHAGAEQRAHHGEDRGLLRERGEGCQGIQALVERQQHVPARWVALAVDEIPWNRTVL